MGLILNFLVFFAYTFTPYPECSAPAKLQSEWTFVRAGNVVRVGLARVQVVLPQGLTPYVQGAGFTWRDFQHIEYYNESCHHANLKSGYC